MPNGSSSDGRQPVILGPGEGRAYPMGRLSAVFKAGAEETGGQYAISEWWLDPYTKGPDPHSHPDDDVFYVLEGTISVSVDGEWSELPAGSFVLIPGGVTHTFENRTGKRAGMLDFATPGDFEAKMPGIAAWFRENPRDTRD